MTVERHGERQRNWLINRDHVRLTILAGLSDFLVFNADVGRIDTTSFILMGRHGQSDCDNERLSIAECAYLRQLEWLIRIYLNLGLPAGPL